MPEMIAPRRGFYRRGGDLSSSQVSFLYPEISASLAEEAIEASGEMRTIAAAEHREPNMASIARVATDASRVLANFVESGNVIAQGIDQFQLRRRALGKIRQWAAAFDADRRLASLRPIDISTATLSSTPSWSQLAISSLNLHFLALASRVTKAQTIANRVSALDRDAREEEPSDAVNLDSLRYFFFVLSQLGEARVPEISLAPGGNLYATWRQGAKLFSVLFLPSGAIGWVHFQPVPDSDDGAIEREGGTTNANQVARKMHELHVDEWIRDERR